MFNVVSQTSQTQNSFFFFFFLSKAYQKLRSLGNRGRHHAGWGFRGSWPLLGDAMLSALAERSQVPGSGAGGCPSSAPPTGS